MPEFSGDKLGQSIVVSRTKMGEELLREAKMSKRVTLNTISASDVARSAGMVRFKKNGINVRFLMFRLCGKEIPRYSAKTLKPGFVDYSRSCLVAVNHLLGAKRCLWRTFEPLVTLQKHLKKVHLMIVSHK